jgi:hypothetical protein
MNPAMRCFAVTIPARPGCKTFFVSICIGQYPGIVHEVNMTAETVSLDHFFARFIDKNRLWFLSHGKYICMAHTIFGLEIILVENIIMRDMTIITMSIFPV